MPEIIKIVGKFLVALLQRFRNRISDREVQRYVSSRERYPSRSSEVSRVGGSTTGASFVSVRVMFPSKIRFSILFPGVLTTYQREYFAQQSWVSYFKDDRLVSEEAAEIGYFLPWTDEAHGMQHLFAYGWQVAQQLPSGLSEMHSDGSHLRVVCRVSETELRILDTAKISQLLREFAQKINGLPYSAVKRVKVSDRFPFRKWAIIISFLAMWSCAVVTLMPKITYVRSDQAMAYAAGAFILPGALCMALVRVKGWGERARWSMCTSVFCGAILVAAWSRLAFEIKGEGITEEWAVSSIEDKRQKYTTSIIGHSMEVRGPHDQILSFEVKFAHLRGCSVKLGDRVRVALHQDRLRLPFADSAILLCESPQGSQEIPLLGF